MGRKSKEEMKMAREMLLSAELEKIEQETGYKAVREHRFHPVRKWRFDVAYPAAKIAAEIEGGTWNGGRHVRGAGYQKDMEKYNAATWFRWRVFRFTWKDVESGAFRVLLTGALKGDEAA